MKNFKVEYEQIIHISNRIRPMVEFKVIFVEAENMESAIKKFYSTHKEAKSSMCAGCIICSIDEIEEA